MNVKIPKGALMDLFAIAVKLYSLDFMSFEIEDFHDQSDFFKYFSGR